MRIPQYDQKISVANAPQFNQIQDVRSNDLAALADGVEQVYKVKLQEQEEAQKTAFFQADTSIKMALDKAKFDLAEKIKNGGSYANAEAEYQKAHDAAISQFSSAFDADKSGNTKIRAMAEYQAEGLNNLMQIRDMVSSKRRSDVVASANLRAEQLSQQLVGASPEEKAKIRSQIAGTYASASVASGGSADTGRLRAMQAIQSAEQQDLQLFAQNNKNNPQAVLDEIEKRHKEKLIDTDFYVQARGSAMNAVAELGTANKVESYIADPVGTERPKQQDVDVAFNKYVADNQQLIQQDPAAFENQAIMMSISTGSVPSSVQTQAASYLGSYNPNMSPSDASTAARAARIVSEISKRDAVLTSSSKFDNDTVARANIIVSRTEAGMSEMEAVQSTLRTMTDKVNADLYKKGRDKAVSLITKGKLDIGGSTEKRARFIDIYSDGVANGASFDEAQKIAEKRISSEFGTFNGVEVRNPPQSMTVYDEDMLVEAANSKYKQISSVPLPDGAKVVLEGDRETNRLIQAGQTPSFPMVIYQDGERFAPVFGKDGQPVRINLDPIKMRSDISSRILSGRKETGIDRKAFAAFIKANKFSDKDVALNSNLILVKFINSDYHKE